MFTKNQIDEWLRLNVAGDNNKDNVSDYWSQDSLVCKLVESKVLTDRWDNCATDIIFHSSKKDFIREKLADKLDKKINVREAFSPVKGLLDKILNIQGIQDILDESFSKKEDSIWGTTIHYSDDCPIDKGIMIDSSSTADTKNARHIAVFPM